MLPARATSPGHTPYKVTAQDRRNVMWLVLVIFLVWVGTWGRGGVFHDTYVAILTSKVARHLLVTAGTLVLGVYLNRFASVCVSPTTLFLPRHWRDMLSTTQGATFFLFVAGYVASIWTLRPNPLLWALIPPIVVRTIDGCCYVLGCCPSRRRQPKHAPAQD